MLLVCQLSLIAVVMHAACVASSLGVGGALGTAGVRCVADASGAEDVAGEGSGPSVT